MLITKQFHDYYDGIAGLGIDKSIVYKRVPYRIIMEGATPLGVTPRWLSDKSPEWAEPFHLWETFQELKSIYERIYRKHVYINDSGRNWWKKVKLSAKNKQYSRLSMFVVIACGKPYIGYQLVASPGLTNVNDKYFYDLDQALEYIEADQEATVKEMLTYTRYKTVSIKKRLESRERKVKEFLENLDYHEISRNMKSPLISISDGAIDINPCLKDIGVASCVDPMTLFQEIQMYHSTISGIEDPDMIQVSDETRRDSHGFDDYSFKTRKGQK